MKQKTAKCSVCGETRLIYARKMCGYCYQKGMVDKAAVKRAQNTLENTSHKRVEPPKSKSNGKIPLRTKKRLTQEKSYKEIIQKMDQVKVKLCFFCGKEIKGRADHHHLLGRRGVQINNPKYIVHAHRECHAQYHDTSVKSIPWFVDFVNRLSDIDVDLAEKEMGKFDKL